MNNWSTELVRNDEVEYLLSMDELEPEWDTSMETKWENTLERSEEEAEYQLEDRNLGVTYVDYENAAH